MQAQIRDTINKGELDTFIKHFKEETKPLHDKVGWPIVASWVNGRRTSSFGSGPTRTPADLEAKTSTFKEGDRGRGYHARHQRREDGSPRSRDGLDVGLNGCRTTRIYCRENCPPGRRTLQRNRVTFQSEAEAIASGYRACKVCKPDQGSGPWQPKAVKTVLLPRTSGDLIEGASGSQHQVTGDRA